MISADYFRSYRNKLGFSNQAEAKVFLGAKDVLPGIDFSYMERLNDRLKLITKKINAAVNSEIKNDDIEAFNKEQITDSYDIMKSSDIIPKLNNQGRRPEQVYFSWMRGYVFSQFFKETLGRIFGVSITEIKSIGDDDLKKVETFQRTPRADLELINQNQELRIEMQSGFSGINDIKQHKVLEARRVFELSGIDTLDLHFDLYNGQVAFVLISRIPDKSVNWITRQQLEGQTVFNIDQNLFLWKLTDKPPKFDTIKSIVFTNEKD
jgi:uncharacterized protein YfkK (UPF0435 family)